MINIQSLAIRALLLCSLFAVSTTRAKESLPDQAKIQAISVHPKEIHLSHPFAYSQLLLTGKLANGDEIDVTRIAEVSAPKFLTVSNRGVVRPVSDGGGVLKVSLQGNTATIPIKVSGQKEQYQVSYTQDVMPTMSKLGCNAGTCHGAQKGKNGFKLSLRGYDPEFDYRALTDDLEGRRFNRASPENSLMLLKTTGAIPHEGGVLMNPEEPYYKMFRAWIANGVKIDLDKPRVKSISMFPSTIAVPLPGMKQQVAVLATYTDGTIRDVSQEAFVESSNTEVVEVDNKGLATSVRRGEATLMARYQGSYSAATLIVMGDRSGFAWKPQPQLNYIDELVDEKLQSVKVLPSGLCTDDEFLRRIYLDLTGLPPSVTTVEQFLKDKRPSKVKRDEIIKTLIGSKDFIEHWTNKWADLLQVNRKFLGMEGAKALRAYIQKAIAENMPYDQFVYKILTASGSTIENPAASYFKVLRDPADLMENTTHLFLAIRFNCNKCHDHPFERWTQDQYYQMSAYFARIGRKEDPKYKGKKIGGTAVMGATPLVEIIYENKAGEVKHERTGEVTPPEFPFTHADLPKDDLPRRLQLAKWITSPANPYFAKSYVNRIWSYLTGVGLIEPVDDIRAGNPPTNPKLLDRLTQEFIDSKFDVRKLMTTICQSRVYQSTIKTNRWNEDDEINYSHALARRLPAEVLYDVIHRASGSRASLPGLPAGARAAQLLDSNVELPGGFLKLFGKPPRESACECERSDSLMLGPVLTLINGPIVANALKDPNNRINQIVSKTKDDRKVVEQLFLAFLNRYPTAEEVQASIEILKGAAADHARLKAEFDKRTQARDVYLKELDAKQAAWEKSFGRPVEWKIVDVKKAVSKGGATITKEKDGSLFVSGKNPFPETYTVNAQANGTITAIRLEVLKDKRLPANGPGRPQNGNFVLNEFKLLAGAAKAGVKLMPVQLQRPQATFSQGGFPIKNAIDNRPNTGWAIAPQLGRSHTAIFELKTPLTYKEGSKLTVVMLQRYAGKDHNIGKFRLSVTSAKPPIKLNGPPAAIASILKVEPAQRTPAQKTRLSNFYRAQDAHLKELNANVAELGVIASERQLGAQDVAWSLINTRAFLFNH